MQLKIHKYLSIGTLREKKDKSDEANFCSLDLKKNSNKIGLFITQSQVDRNFTVKEKKINLFTLDVVI